MALIETRGAAEPGGPARALKGVLLGSSAAALVIPLLAWGPLPSNDGFQHLVSGFIQAHFDDPRYAFSSYLTRVATPTGHGVMELVGFIEPWLGWRAGFSIVIAIVALAWAGSFYLLATAMSPRRWIVGLLGFAFAPQWVFHMGIHPFLLGIAAAQCALAGWLHLGRKGPLAHFVLGGLLLIAASFHPLPAMVGGIAAVAVLLAHGLELRPLALLAVTGVPSMCLVWLSSGSTQSLPSVWSWTSLSDQLSTPLWAFADGPVWRGAAAVALALLSICLVVRERRSLRSELAFAALGGALILASMAAPDEAAGWGRAGAHLASFGSPFALAAMPLERASAGLRRGLTALVLCVAAANLAWAASFHRDLGIWARPVMDALARLEPEPAVRLSVLLDIGQPCAARDVAPGAGFGALSLVTLGGNNLQLHQGVARVHLLRWNEGVPAPVPALRDFWFLLGMLVSAAQDPAGRLNQARDAARKALASRDIVVVGTPEQHRAFEEIGYKATQREGPVMVARFEGCEVDVAARQVDLEMGLWGEQKARWRVGRADVSLSDRLPCTNLWARAVPGQSACAGVGPAGLVRFKPQADRVTEVACAAAAPP